MWFSARAVNVNGPGEAARRFHGCRDALDGMRELVEVTGGIPVLDRTADGAGLGDTSHGLGGVLGLGAEPVLQVDGDGQVDRARERPDVLHDLVERHVPVQAPEREGKAGARRRERVEAERFEHTRRARVPRVRDHERRALVERPEPGRAVFLARTHSATLPDSGRGQATEGRER